MSDLQARLAKLRASNQSLKAITDRIDSAKVLAANVDTELEEVIEALPEVAPPARLAVHATAPTSTPVLPIKTANVETTADMEAALEPHSESEPETKPVFVKDTAPQVAGVLPESVAVPEEAPSVGQPNEDLHATLQTKVRREGSN
jgi:hypothetical protein